MILNLVILASFLTTFQLLFVSLFLITHKKGNRRNNFMLGLLFGLFFMALADFTLRISGIILPFPIFHFIDDGLIFLFGPLLYMYVQMVVFSDFKLTKRKLIHLIPYGLFLVFLNVFYFQLNIEDQKNLINNINTIDLPSWVNWIPILYVHVIIYWWYSWRTLKTYRSVIQSKYSKTDEINLNWLSFMLRTFIALIVVALVNNYAVTSGNLYLLFISITIMLIFFFLFVNSVIVKALNQPQIFSGIQFEELKKYSGYELSEVEMNIIRTNLVKIMEQEKLFLKSDLSSQELADKLSISPKVLSQVMNQGFKKNFFYFINSYRCEEVKTILKESSENTISEAMYQAGFNSKSSFNTEFKKITGQTPSQFKKSLTS